MCMYRCRRDGNGKVGHGTVGDAQRLMDMKLRPSKVLLDTLRRAKSPTTIMQSSTLSAFSNVGLMPSSACFSPSLH